MKEQVDIVLRYAIFIYGTFCIYGYLSDVNFEVYKWIPLAILLLLRLTIFGKLYRK